MSDNGISITVDSVGKTFRLPHNRQNSIKNSVINLVKGGDRTYETQEVFKDVSFEIKKGEFFGIVGRNGSGKSTLLKMLAGIYQPTSGQITVNGSLTPFIELGVGFNPELTGRENVFLNGALLGFSRDEMNSMYDDIVAFAELERFMDQKLKNYSSGMQVRLAFSIAIRAKTDILLIDEVLAVGDQSFQEKCFDYFSEIKKSNTTVIFVTHDMSNVERYCDRVFIIDKNSKYNGLYSVNEAVHIYNQLNHQTVEDLGDNKSPEQSSEVYIKRVDLVNDAGKKSKNFESGSPLKIEIHLGGTKVEKSLPLKVGIAFHDREGNNLAGPNSGSLPIMTNRGKITYNLKSIPFNMGRYNLTVAIFDDMNAKQYAILDKAIEFFVNTDEVHYGKFILDGEWVQ